MSLMIKLGNELLRIDPTNPRRLQCSDSEGRVWSTRYETSLSAFLGLTLGDKGEILAKTTKGLCVSFDGGHSWRRHY